MRKIMYIQFCSVEYLKPIEIFSRSMYAKKYAEYTMHRCRYFANHCRIRHINVNVRHISYE